MRHGPSHEQLEASRSSLPPISARDVTLDIKRDPPKQTKKYVVITLGLVAIVAVSIGISRLKPAAPPVEKGTLWFDTVKRGPMTRDVNAPGTLEPEYVRNITALTSGRVEDLPVKPGMMVTTNTVLVVAQQPRRGDQGSSSTSRR